MEILYILWAQRCVCVWDPAGGLLLTGGFFACKENFAITKCKLFSGRALVLVQISESLQVSLFSTRSPDILTSAQMRRWMNPAELHFVCALSKMNCRADKFFTPCPWQLCELQLLSKLKWKVSACHYCKCHLRDRLQQVWTCTRAWKGGCQSLYSKDSAGMWRVFCNFNGSNGESVLSTAAGRRGGLVPLGIAGQ